MARGTIRRCSSFTGTLVSGVYTGGRPDKPFIQARTLPDGASLPDIKPANAATAASGSLATRDTGGRLAGTPDGSDHQLFVIARTVKADTERRELVSRETTVKATDKKSQYWVPPR